MIDPRQLAAQNKERSKSEEKEKRTKKETPEEIQANAQLLWEHLWQQMTNYKYHGITLAIDCKGYSKPVIETVCKWLIDQGQWTAKAKPEKDETGKWTTIMRVSAKQ